MSLPFFGLKRTGSLPCLLEDVKKKTEVEKMIEQSKVFTESLEKYELTVKSIQSSLSHPFFRDWKQMSMVIAKCHSRMQRILHRYLFANTSDKMKPLNEQLAETIIVVETVKKMIISTIKSATN